MPVTLETGYQLGFYTRKYQGVLEDNINGRRRQKNLLVCYASMQTMEKEIESVHLI